MQVLSVRRGSIDPTTCLPVKLVGDPHTLLLQAERTRDDREGQHPIEYYFAYEYDFNDVPEATLLGEELVAAAGPGATVKFPGLPKNTRVLAVYHDTLTAWVNDAGTEEIDEVNLGGVGGTVVIADAAIDGTVSFITTNVGLPLKTAAVTTPMVCFTAAAGVKYTAGKGILMLKCISYFDK